MVRKLILLSDGTGNSAAKLAKTNVWRTYQAIDLSSPDQLAMYDDGVGTSSIKPLALLGGMFGWGLKRNVLWLYDFLCRNHRDGDLIFAFGFSRGAFTIRMLAGLVMSQGLVKADCDADREWLERAAYREYREKQFRRSFPLIWFGRFILKAFHAVYDRMRGRKPYDSNDSTRNRRVQSIEFLGLWDTVDAYGMPIKELKTGIDKFIWPLSFDNAKLNGVNRAYHALALDDERATFHPLVLKESVEPIDAPPGLVRQVWFAGMHSDVGGGYPDDSLSHVSLVWMLDNASSAGLRLKRPVVDEYRLVATPFGPMHDSRAGLSSYYRYSPRKVDGRGSGTEIHESVHLRMKYGGDLYTPISLPPPVTGEDEYEIVWDLVWWRTVAYWLMVILTAGLVALGWMTAYCPTVDPYVALLTTPLVKIAKALVPAMLGCWLDKAAGSPTAVLVLLASIAMTYRWSGRLEGRILDHATATWPERAVPSDASASAPTRSLEWDLRIARRLRKSRLLKKAQRCIATKVIPFVFAAGLLLLGAWAAYAILRIGGLFR